MSYYLKRQNGASCIDVTRIVAIAKNDHTYDKYGVKPGFWNKLFYNVEVIEQQKVFQIKIYFHGGLPVHYEEYNIKADRDAAFDELYKFMPNTVSLQNTLRDERYETVNVVPGMSYWRNP